MARVNHWSSRSNRQQERWIKARPRATSTKTTTVWVCPIWIKATALTISGTNNTSSTTKCEKIIIILIRFYSINYWRCWKFVGAHLTNQNVVTFSVNILVQQARFPRFATLWWFCVFAYPISSLNHGLESCSYWLSLTFSCLLGFSSEVFVHWEMQQAVQFVWEERAGLLAQ